MTHTSNTTIDLPSALRLFKENTQPWADKVELLQGRSKEKLPDATGLFDFIYVDGSHLSTDVLWDGVNAWPKLKPGGLLVFDDYFFTMPGWDDWKRTCHGIDKALTEMAGHVVLYRNHQIAVSKLS